MPTPLSGEPPYATATISGGGGGGGGLTNEADPTVYFDETNDQYFLRKYVYDDVGAFSSVVDTELDGSTVYVASANIAPMEIQPAGGPNVVVTYTRVNTDTTTNVAAGALAVQFYVIADTVTVEGAAVPAGVAVTHDITGTTTDALAIVTSGGGDVLIIEERAA